MQARAVHDEANGHRADAAIVVVGTLPHGISTTENAAESAAGVRFQRAVIATLRHHDLAVSVVSLRPVVSYPRSSQVLFRAADETIENGVDVRQVGFLNLRILKTVTAAATAFGSLLRWARAHRHERRIMLFYNAYNPSCWAGIAAARITGSTVMAIVADVHVPGSGDVGGSLFRRIEHRIAVAGLRRMDAILPLTRATAEDWAPGVPFQQFDGGVPDDMLSLASSSTAADRKRDTSTATGEDNAFVVVYSGRLSELGGIELLLNAFGRITDTRFRLVVTGRGELESLVRAAVERDHRIRYLGFVEREHLLEIYQSADLLVNPHSTTLLSARYVFPSKLLEYIASGRPVLTTATPEIADEYRDLCSVIAVESADAVAGDIQRIAREPESTRLARSAAARQTVIDRRGWAIQGDRLVSFLVEQMERRGI
ncbi:MAG TPA: glycosyltransferase [Gemmatimonadaceae bacterium]|jgi:glycosyltransferase involved in cell wall biosynthesis|nr:glycosyltransferase [Gemmatimonadaceae bacterium]